MLANLFLFLGMIWASPVTLICFVAYVLPLWMLRRYRFYKWDEVAWIWNYRSGERYTWLDKFLDARWKRWSGHSLGNIIVTCDIENREESSRLRLLVHEKEHTHQTMRLGVFQLVLYGLNYAVARWVLRNVNGYYDNIFEIDARRRAGQLVDIIGAVQRIQSIKNEKHQSPDA